jgi:regulator of sigma E protease
MSYVPVVALLNPTLEGLEKIVVFLIMISVVILLHEAGHFIVARRTGVRVNDFALGFGPTLVKWTSPRSGTNYRINLLPIGGYCAMKGEDNKTSEAEQQRHFLEAHVPESDNFQAKSTWQRLAIILAGPISNFVLAFVILFVAAVGFGIASDKMSARVGPLSDGWPAKQAGLQVGDTILEIDGVAYHEGDAIVKKIHASAGIPLKFTILHQGIERTLTITPRADKGPDGKTVGRIGYIPIAEPRRVGPVEAVGLAWGNLWFVLRANAAGLASLVVHPSNLSNVQGVIGMERAASAFQDLGWGLYLQLAAQISVALGILNLLPIPALDGGRAMFIIFEMIRGRPVDPEREALVHFTGFAFLMVLIALVAYHDIANIISGKGVF